MRKFLKVLISMVCIFALIVPSVFADMNDVMFDLESLGVMEGLDKNGDMDAYMTRAEFAQLVVNAMGHSEIAETLRDKGYFSDVSATPHVGAINLLYELKILSGTGVGTFSPDAYVTYGQAGKIMVNVLGYSNIVNGSDLDAYYYQAGALGIYKNVNTTGEYVTRRDGHMIIYNSLNVDVMTENFGMFGTGSYEVVEGNTLKSYLQTAQHHKLTKKTGVVTADRFTYLHDTEIGKTKTNIIQIDGEVLNCDFAVPSGLVGMNVDYYVEYADSDTATVTSIQPTSKNKVIEFSLSDFISASSNVLKYNVNDNALKFKYDETTKVVYNNRRERNWTVENIANYKNGTLRAIDNNEDEVYDVIYIYDYKDAVVEKIYAETKQVYFANSQTIDGTRYLSLDDEEILVNITDADGNRLSVEEIPVDSVISIAKSNDKKLVTVIVSDKKATGTVKIIDGEYITIDSDVYKCANGIVPELGKHIDAYINFMNEVVYIEETVSYDNYAYVMTVSVPDNGFGNVKVALITPGYISETKKDSIAEDGSSETSKKLFFRNTGKIIYPLATNVSVDGEKYKAAKASELIKDQVISYSLNSNNEITKVEIIPPYDIDTYKTYNENGKVFSLGSTYGFGITESETMSICIPEDIAGSSDDDLLVPVMLLNATEYKIKAYDVDEVTSIAGLVVITEKMEAGVPGTVTASSDVAMVKKLSRKIDNGEEKLVVNLITKDGEKNYFVSNLIPNPESFTALGAGDLISYSLVEGNDELNGFSLIQDANAYNGSFLLNAFQANELCLGKVADCKYNYVSQLKNRWTDNITVDFGGVTTTYEVFMTGTPPIYLLEGKNIVDTLTFDDIQIGDKIFVSANVGTVRAIVVRR